MSASAESTTKLMCQWLADRTVFPLLGHTVKGRVDTEEVEKVAMPPRWPLPSPPLLCFQRSLLFLVTQERTCLLIFWLRVSGRSEDSGGEDECLFSLPFVPACITHLLRLHPGPCCLFFSGFPVTAAHSARPNHDKISLLLAVI